MDIITRQEEVKNRFKYEAYTRVHNIVQKHIEQHMDRGEDFCIIKIPFKFEDLPSFNPIEVGDLICETLRNNYDYEAITFVDDNKPYIMVTWTPVQMFRKRRVSYEMVYKKCEDALRLYLESDVYRITQRKHFFYQVPKSIMGASHYCTYTAARFISVALSKQKFVSNAFRLPGDNGGVYIDWSHI